MYWYKAQVLERYFNNVFVEELKAFKSLLVDLQFYKVQFISKQAIKITKFVMVYILSLAL